MLTKPAGVWKMSSAAGDRSARATAEAMVAWPQNGTSPLRREVAHVVHVGLVRPRRPGMRVSE